MYTIEFTVAALKSLAGMPANTARLIRSKIDALAANPGALNNNVKRLKGSANFRLRVGDWRVVYTIENQRLVIVIVKIAPRGSVYDEAADHRKQRAAGLCGPADRGMAPDRGNP